MNNTLEELFDNIEKELPKCVIWEEEVCKTNEQSVSYFFKPKASASCGLVFSKEDLLSRLESLGLSETVNCIISLVKGVSPIDVELVTSMDYILKNVSPRVLNLERNLSMKDEFVHLEFLDFLVVFQVRVGDSSYLLRRCLFEPLGIELGELFETAKENMAADFTCIPVGMQISGLLDTCLE